MSRRVGSRALAVGSLAAAVPAGAAAVLSALGSPAADVSGASAAPPPAPGLATQSVSFGRSGVVVQPSTSGLTCFRVRHGGSTVARSCTSQLASDEIAYASSRYAVGGLAGPDV